MKVILDEKGEAIPDAEVESRALYTIDIFRDPDDPNFFYHVSNMLAIDALRAKLAEIPIAERPEIQWEIYGKEVHFNEYLAGQNEEKAWENPLTWLSGHFCGIILRNASKLRKEKSRQTQIGDKL